MSVENQASTGPGETPGRLISHFQNRDTKYQGSGWSELWDSNESNLWDRGYPSPPLVKFLAMERLGVMSPFDASGNRKKALVPGCGRGYDPVALALHGFDAYGLEISSTAVATAQNYASEQLAAPKGYNFPETDMNGKWERQESPGEVVFFQGDYFKRDWEAKMDGNGGFDVIYDYTFLCALPPDLRHAWAERASQLLKPGGLLICLEFPLWKDHDLPGPPWGLKGVYWDLLAKGGDGTKIEEDSVEDFTSATNGNFVREQYIKPEKSFPQGRGQDMFSVWRRK